MTKVVISDNESFDSLLKRFNRKVQQDGILRKMRRCESLEKPSMKRKRKEAAKRRKSVRASRK